MRAAPVIAAGALLALSPATLAQVTVNPGALESLRPRPTPERRPPARPHGPPARPPAREAQPRPETRPETTPRAPAPVPAKPTKPEKPALPAAPPAILALPPPVVVPLAPPPPPPAIPVAEDAPGAATPIGNGLRITFGPDRADLNPATEAALRGFARAAQKNETSVNVYAYAAGSAEDPSTPRRLSLARALAARAVLMAEGIPSACIYPRALGPTGGAADPDRVDVVAGQPGPPPAPAAAK